VKWRPGSPAEDRLAAYRALGARREVSIPHIDWDVILVAPARLYEIKDALTARPGVLRCDFSRAYRAGLTPNDPYYPYMWAPPRIRADRAWDVTLGSPSVVVAILDTGLDYAHVDLAPNAWTNPGEIPNNGIDDDGNGYVDDVHGYDFTYHDGEPNDVFGHGTGCAGIVAAAINNAEGVVGIAPQCRLMGLKCARDDGYFFDDAVAPAFVYAADMGARVTSNSYYGDGITPAQMDAIDYAHDHGVLSVVAAGNDDRVTMYYPAGYDVALAVGALETNDTKAWFSNYGSWVDVIAPGTSLYTTAVGNGYMGFAGTSGACPHVSGLAGLVFSMHPDWTPDQVKAQIERTAEPIIDPVVGRFGNYGVIDCRSAVSGEPLQAARPASLLWVNPIAAPAGTGCASAARASASSRAICVSAGRWPRSVPGATTASTRPSPRGPSAWTAAQDRVRPGVVSGVRGAERRRGAGLRRDRSLDRQQLRRRRARQRRLRGAARAGRAGGRDHGAVGWSGVPRRPVPEAAESPHGSARAHLHAHVPGRRRRRERVALPLQLRLCELPVRQLRADRVVPDRGRCFAHGHHRDHDQPERFRSYETNVFLAISASTGVSYGRLEIDQLTVAAK
jgi:subtilisin family serine protease